jgi:NADPH:quinone reductase-like Zn-dependent oxidoreductase
MRAVIVRQYGGPEVLELVEAPTPEPAAHEVRIAVEAAAVNPVDPATAAGYLDGVTAGLPQIGLGWDLAGRIDAVGSDVVGLAPGDQVIALIDVMAVEWGAYATHAIVPATAVAPAPDGIDPVAAATLPLNALTADQALDLIDLSAGQSLLVTGAAGGVGDYVVSLGARRGLRVVALAGPADEAEVRAAGAAEFVARSDDPSAGVRALLPEGVDGAIDAAQLGAPVLAAVRDGGRFVAVTDPATPAPERGITVKKVSVHHDGARLADLAHGAEEGWLRLRVATTLPLDQAADAHRLLAKGGVRGRIVLVP